MLALWMELTLPADAATAWATMKAISVQRHAHLRLLLVRHLQRGPREDLRGLYRRPPRPRGRRVAAVGQRAPDARPGRRGPIRERVRSAGRRRRRAPAPGGPAV